MGSSPAMVEITDEIKAMYPRRQINSQRYLGPPIYDKGPEPGHLTEIYIANLGPKIDEYNVLALTLPYGNVYQVRLPVTFNAAKGFAYVRYYFDFHASTALKHLNNMAFENHFLRAERSWDTRKIQILNWPQSFDENFSLDILKHKLDHVKSVKLYPNECETSFIVVEFESHNAAAIARREIKNGTLFRITNLDHQIHWTRGDFDIPEDYFHLVKELYVGQLPPTTGLEELASAVVPIMGIRPYIKIIHDGYAFMIFQSHSEAAEALLHLKAKEVLLRGNRLSFNWVKGQFSKNKVTNLGTTNILTARPKKVQGIPNFKPMESPKSESSIQTTWSSGNNAPSEGIPVSTWAASVGSNNVQSEGLRIANWASNFGYAGAISQPDPSPWSNSANAVYTNPVSRPKPAQITEWSASLGCHIPLSRSEPPQVTEWPSSSGYPYRPEPNQTAEWPSPSPGYTPSSPSMDISHILNLPSFQGESQDSGYGSLPKL